MTSILKRQLFRLKKSKVYWGLFITCGVIPIISLVFILMLYSILDGSGDQTLEGLAELLQVSPLDGLSSLSVFSSDASIFALIASAVVLSKEFSNGTMRNVLLANKSRSEMFISYLLTALIICVSYFVVEFVMFLSLFGIAFGFTDPTGSAAVTAVLCHFAMGLSSTIVVATCVCCMLFACKKTAGTIIFPLLLCLFAPGVISSIISSIISALYITGQEISETAMQFLPFINWNVLDPLRPSGTCVGMIILYNLVLAAIYFVCGYFPFQKADLK